MCHNRRHIRSLAPILRPDLPVPIARDGVLRTWASCSGTVRSVALEICSAAKLPLPIRTHCVLGTCGSVPGGDDLRERARMHDRVSIEVWPGARGPPLRQAPRCVSVIERALETTDGRSRQRC